ncbi:hypothetical protein KC365_g135 [Hortaea werneckii]|nr:hypothetical protein KC365_g135 [Hortaea werneckii]
MERYDPYGSTQSSFLAARPPLAICNLARSCQARRIEEIFKTFRQAPSYRNITIPHRVVRPWASRSPTPYIEVGDFAELASLINGVREVVGVTREQYVQICSGKEALVLMANHDRVVKGPLAPMVLGHLLPSDVETQIQLPASIRTQIEALEHMLNTQCDEARRQSCEVALKALVSIYRNVRHFAKQHALQSGHLFRWLVELPADFVRCVKAEHPPSLVILAYFAAAVSGIKSTWYLQEWSLPCLQGIRMVLASNMQTWLDWPQEQAERQFPAIRQDD